MPRHLVGQPDAGLAGRRAAGLKRLEGSADGAAFATRGGRQHHLGAAGVGHQRDAVLRTQGVGEQPQRVLEQGQLVGATHRAGHIDQEHQVGGRQLGLSGIHGADADAQQQAICVPRRGCHLGLHCEGLAAACHRAALPREVVDQLLDAHRVVGRQLAGHEHAPHIGIGASIDIDREGREWLHRGGRHPALLQRGVAFVRSLLHRHGLIPGRRHDRGLGHHQPPGKVLVVHRRRRAGRRRGLAKHRLLLAHDPCRLRNGMRIGAGFGPRRRLIGRCRDRAAFALRRGAAGGEGKYQQDAGKRAKSGVEHGDSPSMDARRARAMISSTDERSERG